MKPSRTIGAGLFIGVLFLLGTVGESKVTLAQTACTNMSAGQYRGQNGQRITCVCPANFGSGSVWGTDIYTDDSSICTAAVHAGLITLAAGGTVAIEIRPGQPSYIGSVRNGVSSTSYGPWPGSYVFAGSTAGTTTQPQQPPTNTGTILQTNKSVYGSNESVVVEYSGLPGNPQDWITVVQASAPDSSYGQWFFTGGKQSGSLSFNGLPPGNYEARAYFNWPQGGYNVQARSVFTVGGGTTQPQQPSTGGSQTFSNPGFQNGYRLDWCLHWAQDCGEPAASAWCRAMGYAQATQWNEAVDIGASSPTYVIGDNRVCNQQPCDGFSSITCAGTTQPQQPPTGGGQYLGCFNDTGDRDLNGDSFSDGMTTEKCLAFCSGKNFQYAGTQYASQCFCGNTYGKYGQGNPCNMSCSGNSGQMCGGTWANSVYRVSSTGGITQPQPPSGGGSQAFSNPGFQNGYRLDWCLYFAQQCGEPAASAWCRAMGYSRATQWDEAVDIGASSPTYVIGDGRVCNQQFCDGFSSVTCVR